jgi:hypothetical protein
LVKTAENHRIYLWVWVGSLHLIDLTNPNWNKGTRADLRLLHYLSKKIMYGEAKKLHLIEAILKIENPQVLDKIEAEIANDALKAVPRKSFKIFAGTLSDNEAETLKNLINQGCETIDANDWK